MPPEKSQYIIDRHNETSKKLGQFIVELIARRTLQVKAEEITLSTIVRLDDDIVTRMLRTGYPKQLDFDIKRLGINAGGLLIGAIETTSQAVAQVIQYLLDRPEWLARQKPLLSRINLMNSMASSGRRALCAHHPLLVSHDRK